MKKSLMLFGVFLTVSGCSTVTLKVEPHESPKIVPMKNMWVLSEDLNVIYFEKANTKSRYRIRVPAGFVTDLASIPNVLRPAFGNYHNFDTAGIVHDYLYWVQPCEQEDNGRRIADKIYRDTMKRIDDVNLLNRWIQWTGLKAGGMKAWENNRNLKRIKKESRFMPTQERNKLDENTLWSDIKNSCCSDQQDWEINPPDKNICKIKAPKAR